MTKVENFWIENFFNITDLEFCLVASSVVIYTHSFFTAFIGLRHSQKCCVGCSLYMTEKKRSVEKWASNLGGVHVYHCVKFVPLEFNYLHFAAIELCITGKEISALWG